MPPSGGRFQRRGRRQLRPPCQRRQRRRELNVGARGVQEGTDSREGARDARKRTASRAKRQGAVEEGAEHPTEACMALEKACRPAEGQGAIEEAHRPVKRYMAPGKAWSFVKGQRSDRGNTAPEIHGTRESLEPVWKGKRRPKEGEYWAQRRDQRCAGEHRSSRRGTWHTRENGAGRKNTS